MSLTGIRGFFVAFVGAGLLAACATGPEPVEPRSEAPPPSAVAPQEETGDSVALERLAERAQRFSEQGAVVSAAEAYAAMLLLDPEHGAAVRGLDGLIAGQESAVRAALEGGDLEAAARRLDEYAQLAALAPERATGLGALEAALADARAGQREEADLQARIARGFDEARALERAGDPVGALARYQDVLRLDSGHAGAREAQRVLLTRQLAEVDAALQAGRVADAEAALATYRRLAQGRPEAEQVAEREQRLADLRRQQAEAQALEELLSAAARQASAGDVAGAHQRYREVLAREPGHEAAQQALRELARMQEGRVLDRLDAGQLEPAARELAVLRELRASLALEDTLERLEERFDVARAAQQRELGVAERLAEARQLEAMGDILRAYARYQEVLDLEAGHAEASAAQVRLVRSQREEVEQALAAGRVEAAERALARYRQLSEALPEEDARLAGLEDRLGQMREARRQQERIDDLLAQAQALEGAGELLRAQSVYREVLDLDAENAGAQSGQERVAATQRRLVEQALSAGQMEQAEVELARYRQLSEALPEEGERLAGLEDRLGQMREARRQQERIDDLLAQAQALEGAGDLLRAQSVYREVLDLDAENSGAQSGQERVAATQRRLVEQALSTGQLEQAEGALNLYRQLSEALPQEQRQAQALAAQIAEQRARLAAEQARLEEQERQRQEEARRQAEAERSEILTKGEELYGSMTVQDGHKGFNVFYKILSLDPQNELGRDGMALSVFLIGYGYRDHPGSLYYQTKIWIDDQLAEIPGLDADWDDFYRRGEAIFKTRRGEMEGTAERQRPQENDARDKMLSAREVIEAMVHSREVNDFERFRSYFLDHLLHYNIDPRREYGTVATGKREVDELTKTIFSGFYFDRYDPKLRRWDEGGAGEYFYGVCAEHTFVTCGVDLNQHVDRFFRGYFDPYGQIGLGRTGSGWKIFELILH